MIKPVRKLIKKPGIWRVDGYNNIEIYSASCPRVFVAMSEIKEEGLHSALYLGQATGETAWIKEPLSRISDLLIGSCWRGGEDGGGRRINRLPAMEKNFVVDTSKIQIVTLNEPIELKGVVYRSALPSAAMKLGKNLKNLSNTFYAVVPVLNDRFTDFLVVSCYELYRAYIGVSSRFINNAVVGNLDRYMSWRPPRLKVETKLSRLEQFVAYRGHCSEEGANWFDMPANYLKKVLAYNNTAPDVKNMLTQVIRATFPFKGRTTLTVAGKAFKNINGENYVWCVFAANLLRCGRAVDFDPLIESDRSSINNPMPWEEDVNDLPPNGDDPFDDEDDDENDEQPNVKGKGVSVLESNNFFGAMEYVTIKHFDSGNTDNPVYLNDLGEPVDTSSNDELGQREDGEDVIPQSNEYGSHVDGVERKLVDFIRMIIALRSLVSKHGWKIQTRSYRSSITVESEVVTTFIKGKSTRQSWRLIKENGEERLRQIAWVEIALSTTQFIYLVEMELKEAESGCSTLCLIGRDLDYMEESEFKSLLNMTAVQNRWPRESHKWKKETAKEAAQQFFNKFIDIRISHPSFSLQDNKVSQEGINNWASSVEAALLDRLSFE